MTITPAARSNKEQGFKTESLFYLNLCKRNARDVCSVALQKLTSRLAFLFSMHAMYTMKA